MTDKYGTSGGRRIVWINLLTVVSAAILIGAEVFGAAFAAGWAVASLTSVGDIIVHAAQFLLSLVGLNPDVPAGTGILVLQGLFFIVGVAIMISFLRHARRIEPFTTDR